MQNSVDAGRSPNVGRDRSYRRRPANQRLSRHANRYKEDLRTSSTAVLDRPMSASSRSSRCRSSLYWLRRFQPSAIPASQASALCQDHLRSGNDVEATLRLLAGMQDVLPQDMFHLRNGAKQRLARELIGRLSMPECFLYQIQLWCSS
jgi:hypothetical protein